MGTALRSNFKVPLFWFHWVKLTGVTKDQYGMTIVDLNNLGYRDEPFVLAQDISQVFYVKDMSSKPKKEINKQTDEPKRHIVLSGKRNIVGVEDRTDLSGTIITLLTFHLSQSMLIHASC